MTHLSFANLARSLRLLMSVFYVLTVVASGAGSAVASASALAEDLNRAITFEEGSLIGSGGAGSAIGNIILDRASPIRGTASAYFPNVESAYLQENFAAADDLYVSFYFRLQSLPNDNTRIAQISNDGDTVGALVLQPNGALRLRASSNTVGSDSAPLAVGTVYRIVLHQKRGNGNDAILEGYLATGEASFGGPFAATTSGGWTSGADRLRLGATNSNGLDATFDDITLGHEFPGSGDPNPTPAPTDTPVPATATEALPTSTSVAPTATQAASTRTPTSTRAATSTSVPSPTATHQHQPTATATQGGFDPTNCASYSGPRRVFMDSQAWWIQTPGRNGTDNGHIHTSTCFPLHQTVSGMVPLDIRLTMHENPGKLESLTIQIFGDNGSTVAAQKRFSPALTCPLDQTCVFWVHLDADTTRVPYDGRQEWRIRPKLSQPDGKQMVGSTSWQTYLANGKPRNDYRSYDLVQGKGWYTDASYAIARLDSGFPFAPVSRTWTINYRCESDGPALSECLVTVDPDFHHNIMGAVLFRTTDSSEAERTLTINAAQFTPGAHRLVIRSSANHPTGSTNAGVLVIPFTVP